MITQSIHARLTALSESKKQTLQLIERLSKLKFQPGSTPLNDDEGDVRVELSSEIHESLKALEEELDLLRQEVEEISAASAAATVSARQRRDSERDREKARLSIQVARLGEDLRQARGQFRKAQLQAKKHSELAKQKERELLFASVQEGSITPTAGRRRGQDRTQDEVLVDAASDVTAALRRTHQLMQSELSRSQFAQETLEQSTKALEELTENYSNLDTILASSRNVLSTLLRSQKSDTWYLETAFYILLCTIAWLVFRRWLYGPVWWLVWQPVRLCFKLFFSILATVGLTGGAKTSASQSASHTPTKSLIVKPSASGRPPPIMSGQAPYVRAGGGGYGAKARESNDPSPQGSLSQQVGQMAESSQQQQQQQSGSTDQDEPIVRGDGQPLVESDRPRNPKKRMWDEDVERQKYEEQQAQEQARVQKRDEL